MTTPVRTNGDVLRASAPLPSLAGETRPPPPVAFGPDVEKEAGAKFATRPSPARGVAGRERTGGENARLGAWGLRSKARPHDRQANA